MNTDMYTFIPIRKTFTMFIIIEIRKTRNWFRYETFIYLFEFKVFRHEERETQFLTMLTFPSDPTTCGTTLQTTGLASASSENQLASSKPKSQLTGFFFFKSQNPQPVASEHDVIHIPSRFLSGVFIVTSVIVTSSLRAREHLHSMCAPN